MPDLADPGWFAVDLHVPDKRFGMLQLDEEQIGRAAFLDTRLDAPIAEATPALVTGVVAAKLRQAPVGWLFHTSFCASTLLARALHVPPHTIALKEPFVLRRLSDARKSKWSLEGLLPACVKLLARPWHTGGAVVIKPTHVALNIAVDLVQATPKSRAMILTSPLVDFLISNIKKDADSQNKINILVERALKTTAFGTKLAPPALHPPDYVAAAGLQWAAQRELVLDITEKLGPERIRVMDATELLADVPAAAWRCAEWIELPVPRETLIANARDVATRNAKAVEATYSPEHRAREAEHVEQHYGEQLARARAWLDEHVLPMMRPAALADPARWG